MEPILGVETSWHDRDALVRLAKSVNDKPKVAEVGTWVGHTANFLADAGCLVWAVDTFTGTKDDADQTSRYKGTAAELYEIFRANIGNRLGRTITPVWQDSITAAGMFADGWFDLVFLDADHRYRAVRDDLKAWIPKVWSGGIVACHDYNSEQFPGVTKAVGELGVRVHKIGQCIAWFQPEGKDMPETETPALPLLCDHDGCNAPAVGKYVVGGKHRQFEEVLRCEKHAGVAECKEKVNAPVKV